MTSGHGQLGRRAFLCGGSLLLASAVRAEVTASALRMREPHMRFGMLTDLHYADKPPAGTRHYRETLAKLAEVAERFRQDRVQFVVELGDFIDAADSVDVEQRYLATVNTPFAGICEDRHYVLGNHCVDTLTKEEFLQGVKQERSYYSFERGGIHCIVLDACFRGDGQPYGRRNFEWTDPNIPAAELAWLKADLERTDKHVIVFVHQRLDVNNVYAVKNAAEVRDALERSGRVLAVFQGHSHQNDYREIGGIHYTTLVAMVEGAGAENNGYGVVEIDASGTIRIAGYRKQQSYGDLGAARLA